jgi:MFS transporter, FHS family, glucose/mannose:H+ symporter
MAAAEISRTCTTSSLNKAAHAAFVPIGMVTVLLGPLLPVLSARWSLNYAQAGSLFTAQFAGATLGTSLSGVIVSRWGFRFAMNAGLFAMAVGVAALPFSSHFLGLACIFCYGGGLGLAIPAANLLVAAINPERRGAALSLLNFSWSLGAVACPFVVAAAARANGIQLFLLAVAGCLLLVLLGIAAMPSHPLEPILPLDDDGSDASPIDWSRRSLFALSGLFFLYVGAENGFGGWIASYAKSLGTSSPTLSVMTPSFFYAALMVGRWMAPLALERIDEIKIARAGLSIACIGMAGLILSRTMPFVVSSVAVAGFGLAAIYPITISRLSQEFGPAASRVGSVMFTAANFGGAFLPWMVGYLSHQFNTLEIGLAVPLAATMLMYILYRRHWPSVLARPWLS